MARQRIHNRRAGRGSGGTGASWISYSDMMAALLLIFVLILTYSLYQYFTMLEAKTKELNAQQLVLDQQTIDLQLAKDELDALTKQLKQEFNVDSIDDAKDLLEQYRLDIEMELDSLEENVNQLYGI